MAATAILNDKEEGGKAASGLGGGSSWAIPVRRGRFAMVNSSPSEAPAAEFWLWRKRVRPANDETFSGPELRMVKITAPLVTKGKAPPLRLPEPSELMAIDPELDGLEIEPVVV